VGHQLLQLTVFFFEDLQAPDLGNAYADVFLFPAVENLLADAHFADYFGNWRTGFCLPKGKDNLFQGELRSFHEAAPLRYFNILKNRLIFAPVYGKGSHLVET
jgi:hypothetical protein